MSQSSQPPADDQALEPIRTRIDAIDEQIQSLLNDRAQCARDVAAQKQAVQGAKPEYYRPEREAQILQNVIARNKGPLSDAALVHLFREMMSACRALEENLHVAYLGPEGTFTQEAALKHFGHAVDSLPQATIDAVFREVEAGNAHYGVVPVENTTEGVVNHTLDQLISSPLKICGEVELRIHHHLLSRAASIAEITHLYSHSQSLAQCRMWINKNLPHVECMAVSSNAEGARRAGGQPGAAAIAGMPAAEIYQLPVLAHNVEDHPDNTTRFLIIGKKSPPPSGKGDKTSLLLSAQNKPGALYSLLKPLAESGISMTRIESRPSRQGMWEYVFFIDIEGHCEDPALAAALQRLRDATALFKILGSYPKAIV